MSRQVFVELELRGAADQAVAFVEGVRLATEFPGPVWYSGREGVEAGGLLAMLQEKLHRSIRVILRRKLARRVGEALDHAVEVHVRVEAEREIDHAELGFDYRCFSEGEHSALRGLVKEDLPPGVSLEDLTVEESHDDEARGAEMYSPAHHYIAQGEGRYVGTVGGIIEVAHRLADQSFIHPGKICLHYVEQEEPAE